MIDWSLAQRIAGLVGGRPPASELPPELAELAADAATRVGAYTALHPSGPLPPLEGVDREEWARANIETMRPLMEPLAEKMGSNLGPLAGVARGASGLLVAAQVGALTGLLSQRVLGQYELSLLEPDRPARLLLVAPNLGEAARGLGSDHAELVRWVTVHEVTHAVQFESVPWLRAHVASLLRELLDVLEVGVRPAALLRLPRREELEELVAAVRRGGLIYAVLDPERSALLDRLQATMSLIEGHAEHVMDAVGADILSTLPQLRRALERRRRERPTAWRLFERIIGLELKMRQYEAGKRFCDEVVRRGGPRALDRAWSAPEALPTLAELDDPVAWMRRTDVPLVTS